MRNILNRLPLKTIIALGLLGGLILNYQLKKQPSTEAQVVCKKQIEAAYWIESTPRLRELMSIRKQNTEEYMEEFQKKSKLLKQLDTGYLKSWWSCHTKYLSEEEKLKISSQNRWDEYERLPELCSALLEHHGFLDAAEFLADRGHLESAEELRARIPK
jgi:hypothetical protein